MVSQIPPFSLHLAPPVSEGGKRGTAATAVLHDHAGSLTRSGLGLPKRLKGGSTDNQLT